MATALERLLYQADQLFPLAIDGFPHFDIYRHDDSRLSLTLAVAGFRKEDLTIEETEGLLIIKGARKRHSEGVHEPSTYLYCGISRRDFTRKFRMSRDTKITRAEMRDGELTIHMERQKPQAIKPTQIAIERST